MSLAIGIAIAASGAALAVGAALLDLRRHRRSLPPVYRDRVRVRWKDGCVQPWAGLDEEIDRVQAAIRTRYPDRPELLDWVLEVLPLEGGRIERAMAPTYLPDGRRVAGTIRVERWLGLVAPRYVAIVVQRETARRAPIYHEVEHIIGLRVRGDVDADHRVNDL
jgi:hypothetical protein